MSRIIQEWAITTGERVQYHKLTLDAAWARYLELRITDRRLMQVFDLHPRDFGLKDWAVPITIQNRKEWFRHVNPASVMIALLGVTWIGDTVGPQELEVFAGVAGGGNCIAEFSLSRMYAPLVMAKHVSPDPKDLETMRMEGYFAEPVVLDPTQAFSIVLPGRRGFSYQRDLVLLGYAIKPVGMMIV